MRRRHGISRRSFCTTGSIWLPPKCCAELKRKSYDRQRAFATLMRRAKPTTAKGSLAKTCYFALNQFPPGLAKNANLPSRYRSQEPEHNFLLHQISERANLILDARSLF